MADQASQAPRLFCFGLGYCAQRLGRALAAEGWRVAGTCTAAETAQALAAEGFDANLFDGTAPMENAAAVLAGITHVLSSVPPDAEGDPVLRHHGAHIAGLRGLVWAGYLSSTAVYGDTGGAPVDEDAPRRPTSERGRLRVAAEDAWLALHGEGNVPAHVFRLSGIYGPGRSALDQVRAGRARRIDKPGHRFARIHVDDIAGVLRASMARPDPGAVYNLSDDAPAAPADVVAHACGLLGVAPPPLVPFAEARAAMSPMARSFWRDHRRVENRRIKKDLGVRLRYPDYRAGLAAILDEEK